MLNLTMDESFEREQRYQKSIHLVGGQSKNKTNKALESLPLKEVVVEAPAAPNVEMEEAAALDLGVVE